MKQLLGLLNVQNLSNTSMYINVSNYSDRALFVFFLLVFVIKKTNAYEMQNKAVMPVYALSHESITQVIRQLTSLQE